MSGYRYHVGIDPDVDKCGLAVWDSEEKTLDIKKANLSLIVAFFEHLVRNETNACVYVEAGWLNKSNWHTHPRMSVKVAAKAGHSVGRNHQRGIDIVELARMCGLPVVEVRPDKKTQKLNKWQFAEKTGHLARTNQDMRDAAMLVYGK